MGIYRSGWADRSRAPDHRVDLRAGPLWAWRHRPQRGCPGILRDWSCWLLCGEDTRSGFLCVGRCAHADDDQPAFDGDKLCDELDAHRRAPGTRARAFDFRGCADELRSAVRDHAPAG